MYQYKILLIDDDDDHRFIIEELIRDAGFENLCFAINGEDGLEKVESEKPDVVITDTNLGGMDGFDVCQKIKAKHPAMKVIVITGHARHVDFPRATQVGADQYAVKTGSCDEIIVALRKCTASLKKEHSNPK